ncbi:uncharacterized protein LOC144178475 isoform X2 [Haemaphysalis longicornis]
MEFLKPPDPLRFSGDISRNWKLFIQKFNLFLASSETTDQKPRPESAKGALLLSIAGEEAIEVYNTFTFAEGESNLDYATVVKKFEEYCDAQQNEVYERYVFRKRVQEPGLHRWKPTADRLRSCSRVGSSARRCHASKGSPEPRSSSTAKWRPTGAHWLL